MKAYRVWLLKIVAWVLLATLCAKILLLTFRLQRVSSGHLSHANKLLSKHSLHDGRPAERKLTPRPKPEPRFTRPVEERHVLEDLLRRNANQKWSLNETCAPYPIFEQLHFENQYYQFTRGGNVSYYLLSAYYDRRLTAEKLPSVVVLGMMSHMFGPFEHTYCQLWFEDSGRPELVELGSQNVQWYEAWGNGLDHVYPTVFTCPLPETARRHRVPQLVSLVFGNPCARASNALHVYYKVPQRRNTLRFGVCLKDMQFPNVDMSERLVEWLEMVRLLGAERVTVYDLGGNTMHPNIRHTLSYYEEQDGLLHIRPFQLMNGHPVPAANGYLSKLLNEVLMYTDCLYRSLYEFDYLAVMDIDEVIMPLGELRNWTALVDLLERNTNDTNCMAHCSLCFRNVYYSKELQPDESAPARFYMLRHVMRVAEHLDSNMAVKCLHNTDYVFGLHNHFPMVWHGACGPRDVSTSLGQMQHYREPDIKETLKVPPPVRDDSMWRFKDQLINNALAVHRQLGWALP